MVNQYVGLKERKRLLNEEIDGELVKMEEALYAYAHREEIEAIFGSDHVAKIKIERKEIFPLKGDPSLSFQFLAQIDYLPGVMRKMCSAAQNSGEAVSAVFKAFGGVGGRPVLLGLFLQHL